MLYVLADDWRNDREYRPGERNHHLFTWTPLSLGHLLAEAGISVRCSRVEHRAWPGRATPVLVGALPPQVFEWVMVATAFAMRRREILALAVKQ